VLGDPVTGEHMLVDLTREGYPLSEGEQLKARLKNFCYCGIMGYLNGECSAACESNPGAVLVMRHASFSFAQFIADKLKPKDDGDWLDELYRLPDTRN
jgi:hypothetical protein